MEKSSKLAKRLLFLILLLWTVVSLIMGLFIHTYGKNNQIQVADAIVVLAGPNHRIQFAADLWHQGYAPFVVCTGGRTISQPHTLGFACRRDLIFNGVPEEAIVTEARSLSTEEHALYLKNTIENNGFEEVIILSDGFHLFRSTLIFQHYGYQVYPTPTKHTPLNSLEYAKAIFREVAAVQWFLFKEAFNIPNTRIDGL